MDLTTIEQRIRAAYWQLAAEPQSWISLTRIRQALGNDIARQDVDAALHVMHLRFDGVHLVPEANQRILTPEDRAAALDFKGTLKHLIAIETR